MEWKIVERTGVFQISPRILLREPSPPLDRALPLLVALHGQGMSAAGFLEALALLPEAERLLLVPEGPYPFEKRSPEGIDVGHSWYIYRGDQAEFRTELERSEAYLVEMVTALAERVAVDRERVTLIGFSQGGYLAGFAALRRPDLFRGLVLAAARLKSEFLSEELARGALPTTLVLHSEEDTLLPWARAAPDIERLRAAGGDLEVFHYRGGHRFTEEALRAAGEWLARKDLDGRAIRAG